MKHSSSDIYLLSTIRIASDLLDLHAFAINNFCPKGLDMYETAASSLDLAIGLIR